MGILNITPDSFSDGGAYLTASAARDKAFCMIEEGADLIDIGGESSRPGALTINTQEELKRVIPVIEAIRSKSDICISVDTTKPDVMRAAVEAGAGLINDISALSHDGALELVAGLQIPVCLMHRQGCAKTMQNNPHYEGRVIEAIQHFFSDLIIKCQDFGIKKENIILDPGFGFGKSVAHNMQIIKYFESFKSLKLPLMLGVSRKSSIGTILNKAVGERLIGGITLSVMALMQDVNIIRTHDVSETKEAVMMFEAVKSEYELDFAVINT